MPSGRSLGESQGSADLVEAGIGRAGAAELVPGTNTESMGTRDVRDVSVASPPEGTAADAVSVPEPVVEGRLQESGSADGGGGSALLRPSLLVLLLGALTCLAVC
ncbi:hypothetical protein DQ04_12041000 [Trypanosoma grayi]|uniref:hypothetical protein n=1 Tax=Trypanosoma grayi TaxID=71804 RepID=UPI0004F40381|nr:hypothetical protein DQ04_12041000 [Trypanosoma grayi]KEG06824.1 hypothetical protein DQ04_12041000 [Trypanosoma grayi]